MKSAIQANDIEFVEFARFMDINPFFVTKYLNLYQRMRGCMCLPIKVPVFQNKYKKKQLQRLIYYLIQTDRINKLSSEMYYLLRDWYNEYVTKYNYSLTYDIDQQLSDEKIKMNFEQFLFCQQSEIYVKLINEINCHVNESPILDKLLKANNFDITQSVTKAQTANDKLYPLASE